MLQLTGLVVIPVQLYCDRYSLPIVAGCLGSLRPENGEDILPNPAIITTTPFTTSTASATKQELGNGAEYSFRPALAYLFRAENKLVGHVHAHHLYDRI